MATYCARAGVAFLAGGADEVLGVAQILHQIIISAIDFFERIIHVKDSIFLNVAFFKQPFRIDDHTGMLRQPLFERLLLQPLLVTFVLGGDIEPVVSVGFRLLRSEEDGITNIRLKVTLH
ncbi:MAG: hypothetical protein D6712_02325 [Chloroflexi bacterium]|nr:MAG: hypothetical protein D6712_02325 [Chloroflexota bacterium]